MLNGTMCATERTLCCIMENYQTPEGVIVPEVLRPYMGGKDFIPYDKEATAAFFKAKEEEEKREAAKAKSKGKGKGKDQKQEKTEAKGKGAAAPQQKKQEAKPKAKQAAAPQFPSQPKWVANPRLDELEIQLGDYLWLGGTKASAADREAYDDIKDTPPNVELQPNLFAWYALVSRFSDSIKATWTGEAANAAPAKRATAKKTDDGASAAAAGGDDVEFDPFAEGGDDEDAAAQLKAKAALIAKKAAKKPPVAKSLVVWDVKGWDDTTDLTALGNKILAEISMDGLSWKTEFKLEPVAFGVKKLCIGAVIEDEKVSADGIAEEIEKFEDFVQSVDIAVFNKL